MPARELADVAATIGRDFAFEILAKATDLSEDALVRSIDELWRRRIVREGAALTYDFTHEVKLQGQYRFPFGLTFSGNYTFRSGTTWTPRDKCLLLDPAGDPTSPSDCYSFNADVVRKVRYFTEPRGSKRLGAQNTLDLRAEYQIRVKPGTVGVYLDAFNVFNHARFDGPNTDPGSSSFGIVSPSQVNQPRVGQLALKLSF